jgi:hypothetical protein
LIIENAASQKERVMQPADIGGMVERLTGWRRPTMAFAGYGRDRPGRSDAEAIRLAARLDRRQHRRPKEDVLRGRLLDLAT